MRVKLDALFVKEQADSWIKSRESRIEISYEKAIEKAMKRRLSNLFLGRTREEAIKFLDNFYSGFMFNSYKDRLEFEGNYWADQVYEVRKSAELSLSKGDGTVWTTQDELFFIKEK